MTKAEILEKVRFNLGIDDWSKEQSEAFDLEVSWAMGQAQLACLEKAAENAKIDESWTDIHGYTILRIDKESITSKDNLI